MNPQDPGLLNILTPVSLGELVDKITILEIKKENMTFKKLRNVEKELEALKLIVQNYNLKLDQTLLSSLKEVNKNLWAIEDKIRNKEHQNEFDKEFIELARTIYKENDKRAFIKKEINLKYKSNIIEEKSYNTY